MQGQLIVFILNCLGIIASTVVMRVAHLVISVALHLVTNQVWQGEGVGVSEYPITVIWERTQVHEEKGAHS